MDHAGWIRHAYIDESEGSDLFGKSVEGLLDSASAGGVVERDERA